MLHTGSALIDEAGRLEPDTVGHPHTGNVILFVHESAAAPAVADASTNALRYVDLYRCVCVYPHGTSRKRADPPRRLPPKQADDQRRADHLRPGRAAR